MTQQGIRIAIADHNGTLRLLTKIVGLSDGGFAVTAPYHSARQGFLMKFPVDYSRSELMLPTADVVPYTADDRVKLSLHLDGFVQFSGERQGRIVSGRDGDGQPKGLGLIANRLTSPLATDGPTFGLLAWGLDDYKEQVRIRDTLAFGGHDVYYRDCTLGDWSACIIEGFVYPRSYLSQGVLSGGRLVLPRRFPHYQGPRHTSGLFTPTRNPLLDMQGALLNLTLVDVGSPYIVIGLLVSRATHGFPSTSGFTLNSPSDMRHALAAVYPNPTGTSDHEEDGRVRSLNYTGQNQAPSA
ncbi:hypothetical protein [Geodermatophilus sp. DSM 44513]|uniref:hypothetical protein n=1 Tax=Geodermatophilus sp. DSM 44513 TaxID=1528104 RepID=UPI001272EDE6|nr:hypothetical protein [Geodermatophilus sp. DSM 44513]WNV76929.1 hypothetical protein RTG05_06540 [Geodermatophilus sp. DSM 44513]